MSENSSSKTVVQRLSDVLYREEPIATYTELAHGLGIALDEIERLTRENELLKEQISAMTDCISPREGQSFEERAEELNVIEVAYENQCSEGTSDWQPIETAPKDRCIDLWTGDQRMTRCYWDHICSEWRTTGNSNVLICFKKATHWMEIPTPPQSPSATRP